MRRWFVVDSCQKASGSLPEMGRFLPGAQATGPACEIEGFPRTPAETIVGTPPGRMIGLTGLLMKTANFIYSPTDLSPTDWPGPRSP